MSHSRALLTQINTLEGRDLEALKVFLDAILPKQKLRLLAS